MKRQGVIGVLVVLLAGMLFAGGILISQNTGRNKEPSYVFTYAENQAADYPTTQGAQYFARLVKERTDGEVEILIYSGGVLGTEKEIIKQMRYGGVDFARISISQVSDLAPEFNVLQMPYLYRNADHMWKVLDGEIGKEYLENFENYGLVGLSWYDAGSRSFYMHDAPITSLSDMKGKWIRVQESSLMADMVTALGANPYQIDYSGVYASLEQGIVDGSENNLSSYVSTGHYEVAKYYTLDEHTRVPEVQICSLKIWEQLPEEYQQIIRECAEESALYERQLWTVNEVNSWNQVVERGAYIYALSDEEKEKFQKAMEPVYEKYCGEYMDLVNKIMDMK